MINYNVSIDSLCVGGIVVSSNEIIKSITTEVLIKKYGINLDSKYMNEISNNYLYLGNKVNCAEYIRRQLEHMSADVIVNRTMYMTREFGEKQHAIYFPKCQEVKY